MSNMERVRKIKNILAQRNVDAILIANEKNIYYFTGFSGGFRLLIPLDGESILFVHSVNYEAAKEMARGVRIELIKVGERADIKVLNEISRYGFKSIGFDNISAREYMRIRDNLRELRFEPLEDAIWSLRKVKDEGELALIRRAAELSSRGMERAIEILKPGMIEREIAAEIEYEMRHLGSDGVAFDTIVCSGPESAFPHGGLGEREIKNGDLVVIDVGAKYRGYCADMTRTLIAGIASEEKKRVCDIVKEAQKLAMSHLRAGVKAKGIDEAARRYIADKGYGEYFVHGLGHGVGLDIHEPPALNPLSEEILSHGNVITVEPGVYIPRFGGARIEDTMLVLENGAMKLTRVRGED